MYSDELKATIIKHYLNSPHSQNQTADLFGIHRRTMEKWLVPYPPKKPHPHTSPDFPHNHIKILFLDIETLPTIGVFYSRKTSYISPKQIIQHGMMASFQYSYGAGKVMNMNLRDMGLIPNRGIIRPENAKPLVEFMARLVEDADIVIGHNGKRFDLGKLHSYLIKHDCAPMHRPDTFDTLQAARRIGMNESNALDDLAHYYGIRRKLAGGMSYDVGIQALCGDAETWQKIIDYGDNDVDMLRELYIKIRPHSIGNLHPNMNLFFNDLKERCVVCGSEDIQWVNKNKKTNVQLYNKVKCRCCGHLMQERTTALSKEKRGSILKSC